MNNKAVIGKPNRDLDMRQSGY